MRCSKCGSENFDRAKFCDRCAAPLPLKCPSCGASNRASAKFCTECAAALVAAPVAARSSGAAQPARPEKDTIALRAPVPHDVLDGERKMVTVLFANFEGSTVCLALERRRDMIAARGPVERWSLWPKTRSHESRLKQRSGPLATMNFRPCYGSGKKPMLRLPA